MLLIGSGVLAAITLERFVLYTLPGRTSLPPELQYAHESAVVLGTGFVAVTVLLFRARNKGQWLGLAALDVLIMTAMMASGRRSAMLCLFVGLLLLFWLLFPKRPWLVAGIAVPVLLGGCALLASQWHSDSGLLAQPVAPCVSQFNPSARDASSDMYRQIERANVETTPVVARAGRAVR